MSYHPGKFPWFEHRSTDSAKAAEFYQSLFGWKVDGETYRLIRNGEDPIGGFVAAVQGEPSRWNGFLSVADVDASFQAAVAAGARPLSPPRDVPGMGRRASLLDPGGAPFSLWKGAQGDRPDRSVPVGDWCWNELATPDAARSLAFYEGVFGFTHDARQTPQGAPYFILKGPDGNQRGGIAQANSGKPMWMPYVRVEDADAIAARVAPLGGKLAKSPAAIPGVGRIGALTDPLGAALAFIQPAVVA
jgi:predicted enzyme related to lactoylglutathione lyase